ncbi:MAG: hypothetical protein ACREFC_09500 [Stellaceae bacterium]
MRFLIVLLAMLSLPAALTGAAEQKSPARTGPFVAFCKEPINAKACHDAVITIDNYNRMVDMNMITPPAGFVRACTPWPPKYLQGAELRKYNAERRNKTVAAVLAWLNHHPEAKTRATDDGIQLAMRALYPCR